MPNARLSMRKVKEILRLSLQQGVSQGRIAESCSASKGVVWKTLKSAKAAGLTTWDDVEHFDEMELEIRLFGPPNERKSGKVMPDWEWVHRELRRKHVTRALLWEEYCERHACEDTLSLSQFCENYARWRKSLDMVMRQSHAAGEKLFVDFAGDTIPVYLPDGSKLEAKLFVAVMGASNFTFACAFADETRKSWLSGHVQAFEYLGGVPEIVVPDNPKALVHKAHRYEPDLNPEYVDLARHYGTAVIPARVAKPRDKGKVEVGVLLAERWIIAALRNRKFSSLADLNDAIADLLERLNKKPFKKLKGSRREAFVATDSPALRPLPESPFQIATWKNATVGPDYHVEVVGHYYSVPYQFRGQKVRVRFTETSVEVFHRDARIATHARSLAAGRHTFVFEHLPPSHREYVDWVPEDLLAWAYSIGPSTRDLIERVMASRLHPAPGS